MLDKEKKGSRVLFDGTLVVLGLLKKWEKWKSLCKKSKEKCEKNADEQAF